MYCIVRDSKCDYPSACNALETLLIHRSLIEGYNDINNPVDFFGRLCNELKRESVDLYSGQRLHEMLTFGPPKAKSLRIEYGKLALAIEVVDDLQDAIDHINQHGSGHTDVIVTENGMFCRAKKSIAHLSDR